MNFHTPPDKRALCVAENGFSHDQTLRLMDQGPIGSEIAELIEVPPALETAWHTDGYYGSVSHDVKAIYQRYLGRFASTRSSTSPSPRVLARLAGIPCRPGIGLRIAHDIGRVRPRRRATTSHPMP